LFFRQRFRLIVNRSRYRQLSGDIDRRYRYRIGDVEDRADAVDREKRAFFYAR